MPIPALNVERLKRLREAVAESETFEQSIFYHPCGTPACIAGHCIWLAEESPDRREFVRLCSDTRMRAKNWLGLTYIQADTMFDGYPLGNRRVTKAEALDMLDRAIATGVVVWRPL